MADGEAVEFVDGNLGPQRFVAGVDFGDFVVWRRDGVPSYQLACVADDAAMRITEVVRGADLLKSTARQMLLNRALGFADPAWFHCALVTDGEGKRLAKRSDALSLRALRERGVTAAEILPEQAFSPNARHVGTRFDEGELEFTPIYPRGWGYLLLCKPFVISTSLF